MYVFLIESKGEILLPVCKTGVSSLQGYLAYEFDKFWVAEEPESIMQFNQYRETFHNIVKTQLQDPDVSLTLTVHSDKKQSSETLTSPWPRTVIDQADGRKEAWEQTEAGQTLISHKCKETNVLIFGDSLVMLVSVLSEQ